AELAAAAAEAGHRVLRAEPGTEYASTDGTVVLDLADPEHHARLLREAAAPGGSPVESTGPLRIVHTAAATAAPTATADDPEPALDAGCHSLLRLAQAVARELPDRAVELVAATADVFDVLGGDGRDPVGATVAGTCRGIDQEYPRIRCRTVDLEAPAETARAAAGQLLREVELLAAGAGEPDTWLTAWRRGRRWLRTFTEVDLPSVEPERVWRPGGSYLVTGGLRGLGLLLATRLAPLRPKLTLVGRTELPAEDDWDAWLAEHGHDDEVSAILLAVRELRAAGAEVLPLTADVTSPEQAERAVRTARERFGTLHGVVHAAGVPGGGPPHARTRQLTADVLAPKVRGTLAVAEALRDDPPELLVLYSSSVGVLGWRGEGDQAAANAFLDAFAASDVVTEKVARRVVSVAWGPWRRGTRSEPDDPFLAEHLRRYRERYGITDDEGVDALTRVAAAGPAQVVVLTQPFAEVAERVGVVAGAEVGHEPDAPAGPKHPRPDLRTPYLAPRTDTERRIAGVWQDYLGIDEIGVHDPFFDIGGTSMVATAVVGGLGRTLGVDLGPASLFDHPTVAELAALIDGTDSPPEPERAGRGGRRRDRR
ncbi:MAG TPA: SDR family NAD(P)-dependent oxidoreductase, partial [Actinophytocola sp.]|nr:SDR family NAD(P)-dependent oxidoreductase [Actinophytocola sp.]